MPDRPPANPPAARTSGLVTLGPLEVARTIATVLLPLAGRGLILRRPRVVRLAERGDADRIAVRSLRRLHDRHDAALVLLKVPFKRLAFVLDGQAAQAVLAGSPDPFAPATREKRAALAHFQPAGALATRGPARAPRRALNEIALGDDVPIHDLAPRMVAVVEEEVDRLLADADADGAGGRIDHDRFLEAWWRIVRRVVLGDLAAEDHQVIDDLDHLRARANTAYLRPVDRRRRRRFLRTLDTYLRRAEPGSLAAALAAVDAPPEAEPAQQIPQWLFAFDPAGIAVRRALAALTAHPDQMARAVEEARSRPRGEVAMLPFLRACVLESLRLWPTTPGILRVTERGATLPDGTTIPEGVDVVVFAPYLNRDPAHHPSPDAYLPEAWLDAGLPTSLGPVVPFSDGPARCPGRNVVLVVTSTFLSALLTRRRVRLAEGAAMVPDRPLPSVLDPFRLVFDVAPVDVADQARSAA